jgi:integrase
MGDHAVDAAGSSYGGAQRFCIAGHARTFFRARHTGGGTFVATESAEWQAKAAGVAIRAAGLTGLVWHGLRGAAASWAAEAGATQQQVAALLGHQTLQMVQKYGRGAANRTLAGAAAAVIPLPRANKRRPGSV